MLSRYTCQLTCCACRPRRAELEYEAALERRRRELEAERVRTEQEMLR